MDENSNPFGALYKTEKAVRQKVEVQLLKLNESTEYARASEVTFNALLDRYIAEEMPARRATRGSYTSIINKRLRPRRAAASFRGYGHRRFMPGSSHSH